MIRFVRPDAEVRIKEDYLPFLLIGYGNSFTEDLIEFTMPLINYYRLREINCLPNMKIYDEEVILTNHLGDIERVTIHKLISLFRQYDLCMKARAEFSEERNEWVLRLIKSGFVINSDIQHLFNIEEL